MRIFHSPDVTAHDPDSYFRRGEFMAHPESAKRYDVLMGALKDAGLATETTADHGMDAIAAVHTADYIDYLRTAWDRRSELPGQPREVLSGHFSKPQMHRRPEGLLGLIGYYTSDTSTPIRAGTWRAIYGAAQAAISASDAALAGAPTYALCRPPGHHSFADCAAGFCFLNNTAIAAENLRRRLNGRIAVLDIDVHHGNGTQAIFEERDDVLTISIHGDPANFYPYYAGYADEVGKGAGRGFNLNMPLDHGLGDEPYCAAIARGLERMAEVGAIGLVVALGLDASEHDPLSVLKVTTEGFRRAGKLAASARLPTVIIQEGGYLCDALPRNLIAFLDGFLSR